MEKIGVLFGMESTFPGALVARINDVVKERGITNLKAEFVQTGGVFNGQASGYRVIVDRISQDIPFYRAYLKNAILKGTIVINNPFWWSADDKFFNYSMMPKLGIAIPPTVLLPHKDYPVGTTDRSMRNLIYPLNWDEIYDYLGFPERSAFLKPHSGGGWKSVYHVHNQEELFKAYDETGELCMTLQRTVNFKEYFRCYVLGQEKVHIMPYDPRAPHHERYVKDAPPYDPALLARVEKDALTICRALGYDMNTVEFAVEDGIPYAIDFLNPAPDGEYTSVGHENFVWFVENMAELCIKKALSKEDPAKDYHWASFLNGTGRS